MYAAWSPGPGAGLGPAADRRIPSPARARRAPGSGPQAMKLIDKKYLRRRAGYMRLPTAGGTISRGPMPRPGLPGTGGGPGRPGPQNMEDPMDAVRREIAIMKKLNHRNIVRLVEVLDSEESPNLFMSTRPWDGAVAGPLLPPGLRDRVARAPRPAAASPPVMELAERGPVMKLLPTEAVPPLPEPEALRMFRQLLLGLEYRTCQLGRGGGWRQLDLTDRRGGTARSRAPRGGTQCTPRE